MAIAEKYIDLLKRTIATTTGPEPMLTTKEWETIFRISCQQGTTAIVFDYIRTLKKESAPPLHIVMEWTGVANAVEQRMSKLFNIAKDFADKMADRNILVVVLKGIAFAQYYPKAEIRECHDLDCFMLGQKAEGDRVACEIGGSIEEAGYKHSLLYYKGLAIENHMFLTSFNGTKNGIMPENVLQEMIKYGCKPIGNTNLLCPHAEFDAVFLIKHALRHFITEGICMRHVLDWAFFLQEEEKSVDWNKIRSIYDKTKLTPFANVMTAIVVRFLEVKVTDRNLLEMFNIADERMADKVTMDILAGCQSMRNESILQKSYRILKRFKRMWIFRNIADEPYITMVWNTFVFCSYLRRKQIQLMSIHVD